MIKLARDKVIPSATEDEAAAAAREKAEQPPEAADEPSISDEPKGAKDAD